MFVKYVTDKKKKALRKSYFAAEEGETTLHPFFLRNFGSLPIQILYYLYLLLKVNISQIVTELSTQWDNG